MSELEKVSAALGVYASLMEDIKERLEIVGAAAHWQGVPPRYVTEFCSLQFRMICEDIALGCLLAHGDVGSLPLENKLRDKWHAGELMAQLDRLHPAFFPQPCTLTRPEGRILFTRVEQSMTRSTLSQFYGKLGNVLHRGTLLDRLEGKSVRPYTQDEIMGTGHAIHDLLKIHLITLVDGTLVGCILRDLSRNGRANVFATGKALPPESEQQSSNSSSSLGC